MAKKHYLVRVAQPLQIQGQVLEMNGLYYLRAAAKNISALP